MGSKEQGRGKGGRGRGSEGEYKGGRVDNEAPLRVAPSSKQQELSNKKFKTSIHVCTHRQMAKKHRKKTARF